MNNGAIETTHSTNRIQPSQPPTSDEELSRVKRELLQAEVRFAKARATVVGAEADIKVLTARLKVLAK